MNCKICGSGPLKKIDALPLDTTNQTITSEITKCLRCGSFSRSTDYSDSAVQSHFELTSYTDPRYEKQFLENKRAYFEYILKQIESFVDISHGNTCLDFGPSYGHMLDVFKQEGITTHAVEIVDRLRKDLRKRGYQVYRSTAEIPEENTYDIVTFIDSLYYFENPLKIIGDIRPHIRDNGILVIRIPNRTAILSLAALFNLPITDALFLDAKHNFSFKGIEFLCKKNGFRIAGIVLREKGKKALVNAKGHKMPLYKRFYGFLANVIGFILGERIGKKIAPGLLLFCRPDVKPGGDKSS